VVVSLIGYCNSTKTKAFHIVLYVLLAVQLFQKFVGMNSITYYNRIMFQLTMLESKLVALRLSLITTALSSFRSILKFLFIDRYGRRKLMIIPLSLKKIEKKTHLDTWVPTSNRPKTQGMCFAIWPNI
jgi:hypothetical protein